jgi:hypothetical protein
MFAGSIPWRGGEYNVGFLPFVGHFSPGRAKNDLQKK